MRQPKLVPFVVVCLLFVGCASRSMYGNFVESKANEDKLIADATKQLMLLYPPAKNRFELQQPTPDSLGKALVQSMREAGYAVLEFDGSPNAQPSGHSFRYTFDQAGSSLYRLTLFVGSQSIIRPFSLQSGTYVPVGHWSRKE